MEFTGQVVFLTALATMIIAQVAKMLIASFKHGKFSMESVFELAGLPSSHTATATSLTLGVYFAEGFSVLFGVMLLALLYVITDVIFAEMSVSRHAKIINELVPFMKSMGHKPSKHSHLFENQMREEWGHTSPEIITGFLLGIIVTMVVYLI